MLTCHATETGSDGRKSPSLCHRPRKNKKAAEKDCGILKKIG